MNDLMDFEGNKVEVFDFNGEILFNPYHVGKCLDLTDSAVRMAISKMNENQVIKLTASNVKDIDFRKLHNTGENFLKEAGVYKLIFKSRKPEAERFQDWVTDTVLPSIRKTGEYSTKGINKDDYIKEIDIAKAELSLVEVTAKLLNLNDSSKLALATNVYENHNIPTNLLPQYTKSKGRILPISDLLKKNYINMSAIAFNKLLIEKGILKECARKTSNGGNKKFKMLVDTEWGENLVNPKCPKETQPMYYQDKFSELLKIVL